MMLSVVEVKLACGQCSWRVWCGTASAVLSMVMLRPSQPGQAVLDVGGLELRPSVWLSEALLRSSEVLLMLSRSLLEST